MPEANHDRNLTTDRPDPKLEATASLTQVVSPTENIEKCAKPTSPREWQDEPKSVKPDGRAPGLKCPKSTVYLTRNRGCVPKKGDNFPKNGRKTEKNGKKRKKWSFRKFSYIYKILSSFIIYNI
jgi:hypothetical protein